MQARNNDLLAIVSYSIMLPCTRLYAWCGGI